MLRNSFIPALGKYRGYSLRSNVRLRFCVESDHLIPHLDDTILVIMTLFVVRRTCNNLATFYEDEPT
jgi:hypothetical protein